jgi:hypothetical protein
MHHRTLLYRLGRDQGLGFDKDPGRPIRTPLLRALACCGLSLLFSLPSFGASWTPDPSLTNPDQHRRLYDIGRKYLQANFDPDANLVGTPSHHPPNKKQHGTRDSAAYAYALLLTGDPADRELAQAILRKVVITQDTGSKWPTRGAFGWYWEDKPGDLNSAAFVGSTLADITELDRKHPCLEADVREKVDAAGKLAVEAIMHRDVDPGYTNIAILSSAVGAAGQKYWQVPGSGEWAQAKLDAVMAMADKGEFYEYRSPTYDAVDLTGAYLAQRFAFSEAYAAKANATIDHLWQQIAASYHAPTFQLGGPYCRSYGDNMLEYAAGLKYDLYLALDGQYPLPDTETDHEWDKGGNVLTCDLPITVRPEFKLAPEPWRVVTAVGPATSPQRKLSQYRDGDFILGTVNYQDEWKQKRNLVADWRNDGPAPLGMSVGFCIDESNETAPDGFPGAKIHFYCQQEKSAALVALVGTTDIPKHPGSECLVFAPSAEVTIPKDAGPVKIVYGSITTYLYPITADTVVHETTKDARTVKVTRSWTTADAVGDLHVLSYLAVFRPSDQPAPTVSDIVLHSEAGVGSASAVVDGTKLSVSFKN